MSAKEKKKSSALSRILKDIGKGGRRLLFFSIAIIAIAKVCLAVAPGIAGRITDGLAASAESGNFDTALLIKECIFLAVMFLIGYGVDGFVNRNMVKISQSLIRSLRNRAQQKLNKTTLSYMDTHPVGDILSRVTNDMVAMSNSLESTVATLLGQVVLLISLIVMMFITNVKLALIYIVVLPLGILLLMLILRVTNRLFRKQNNSLGDLNALVSDTFSNHLLMKAYGCENKKMESFEEKNKVFYDTYVSSRFLSGFVIPMATLINNVSYIALCIIGGIMLINNNLTIGEFQAFIFYGNMVGTPFSSLSSSMNNVQTGLTAAERVYELLDAPEEEVDPNALAKITDMKGRVDFTHVQFGYVADKQLMKDVSFSAHPGQTMAIVGPSGAGKTTLINLLMRFYDIWDGSIAIDGVKSTDMTKENLRKNFGMVLQDSWIFDGTIAENIAYGRPDATREEIIAAAKTVQCDSFIEKLPKGYDTRISDENSALSAGEKQLLAIARAVIADPPILILDEATSQVDTKTDVLITQAMEKMMQGRTSFIIAHRLYTIKNADQIIFMVDGDIKEVGSHDELIRQGGLYKAMYEKGASE